MSRVYLVVTPFFPEPGDFHGPYVLDQVKAIARTGEYRVVVIKPFPVWKKAEDYEIDGEKVYRCPSWTMPSNVWPNRLSDLLSANALLRKLRSIGIQIKDVAVCHAHVASLGFYSLAIKRRNPQCLSAVQHHGFDVFGLTDGIFAGKKWHDRLCIRRGRRICNAVDLNIGVSKKTLDYVKSYPGVSLKKEYVLYNGVDTSKFYPPAVASKNARFTIGCIGNFWPIKDQMTLIRAVERIVNSGHNDIFVRFIGTGVTRSDCEQYVKDHSLVDYVSFENEVMHNQLLSFYQSLDLFVLPSYWEAFGCVYTEAYACGVPFIAVKGQGIAEIIPDDEQEMWLISKGDDEYLAVLIMNYMRSRHSQSLLMPASIDHLINNYLSFVIMIDRDNYKQYLS